MRSELCRVRRIEVDNQIDALAYSKSMVQNEIGILLSKKGFKLIIILEPWFTARPEQKIGSEASLETKAESCRKEKKPWLMKRLEYKMRT